jgi:hypothetical protein
MFKSKIIWALVLGAVTSVLLRQARINLADNPQWSRIPHTLAAPGTHLVAALNTPGTLLGGYTRLWGAVGFACNLLIYLLFWYALLWTIGYVRGRRNPYDRENTLVPPV